MRESAFPTPEEAVLAEWAAYPEARAFVVSVEYPSDDEAIVVTDTEPSHPMWNYCSRTPAGWSFSHDHN